MKKILALVLALCMVFALCACGSSSGDSDTPAASTVSLNVGTGGESGTYYGYTGILGTVIGQKTDVKLTVVATGGSKDNLVSMQDGMYDLATVQSDVMTYAYNGTNSFADSGKIDGFRVLCALYPETVQIVTTDPTLKTVEDLRGKRVCVGDVGSGTYFNAVDVFAAYDMTIDDVSPVYQSFGDSTESLKDGKIDAAFIVAGAPTTAVTDLATTKDVYLVSLDDEHVDKLLASSPYYTKVTISKDVYGLDSDTITVAVSAVVLARDDVSEDAIYKLVADIFDNAASLTDTHAKYAEVSTEFGASVTSVPYHPGAAKYFAEKGFDVPTK